MATLIKYKEMRKLPDYEPPLDARIGIDNKLVKNSPLMMGHPIIPPGGRNQRHYHVNTAAGQHVVKGRLRMFIGPDHDLKEIDVEEGDFVYVPRGEIHGGMNRSDTEPVELVFTYPGVPDKEAAGTIEVPPPEE